MLAGLGPWPAHAQLLGDLEAGRQRVLMEAVAAVAAAEIRVAHALDGMHSALGADRGGIVHGMVEAQARMDGSGLRRPLGIDRHEERRAAREPLQAVHPVGHAHRTLALPSVGDVIPARPYRTATRHQGRILMQPDLVARVGEAAEQLALAPVGVSQQGQRVVGVAGEDRLVEALPMACSIADLNPRRQATDGACRPAKARALAYRRRKTFDVAAAAAAHRAPAQLGANGQQAVIVEKTCEGLRRIVEHAAKRRRPDAGGHGQEIAVAKRAAEARMLDEVAEREVEIVAAVEQQRRQAVEAQDVARHAQEGGPHQVAALGDVAAERAAVLESTLIEADGERHVGLFGAHAEMVEQRHQVGVVALVVHDEADIDRLHAGIGRHLDRTGVAAQAVLALVDHDVVPAAQKPGGAQTCRSRPDDGDLHVQNPRSVCQRDTSGRSERISQDRGQVGTGCMSSACRSAVTLTRPVSTVSRSSTPFSYTSAWMLNNGRGSCCRPRVKIMNTGHDLPAGTATGRSPGRAARSVPGSSLVTSTRKASPITSASNTSAGNEAALARSRSIRWLTASTGNKVGDGSTNWLGGPSGKTISARVSPSCRCTRPLISRGLPFWVCTVLKRKARRVSSPSILDAMLIRQEVVSAISVLMSRLMCQEVQSCVRSYTAVPMRGALAAPPSRRAYSARCGCTWPNAASGHSSASARTKRTSRCIAPPCARGGLGSIVRAMSLRAIMAAFRRWPPAMAPAQAQGDLVEIFKRERRLEVRRGGQLVRSYRVALGFAPECHKEREGDGRTPEGAYTIDARNPQSAFHLSLRISYPDARDRAHARKLGVPPGGDIYIHGQPNGWRKLFVGHPRKDWTTGCIALTDAEMRELWSLVPTGAHVVIHP